MAEWPMHRTALISDCGTYRYRLTREWNPDLLTIVWVMLNPSTADAHEDDPTIRKCIGFAKRWGAGAIDVVNLFAYRATSPAEMLAAQDPVGPGNNDAICEPFGYMTVVAWGAKPHPIVRDRVGVVMGLLKRRQLYALRVSKSGAPWHPLYAPYDVEPRQWEVPRG